MSGVLSYKAAMEAQMAEWQPIETAPKDGTRILVSDGDTIWVAQWDRVSSGEGWLVAVFVGGDWNYYEEADASFWMLLPPLPSR